MCDEGRVRTRETRCARAFLIPLGRARARAPEDDLRARRRLAFFPWSQNASTPESTPCQNPSAEKKSKNVTCRGVGRPGEKHTRLSAGESHIPKNELTERERCVATRACRCRKRVVVHLLVSARRYARASSPARPPCPSMFPLRTCLTSSLALHLSPRSRAVARGSADGTDSRLSLPSSFTRP
jgi:hypothetical protein